LKKTVFKNREIWLGCHSKLGFFIYDMNQQLNVDINCIRIFLLDEKRTCVVKKEIFRKKILKHDIPNNLLNNKVKEYTKIFLERRITHCYKCKQNLDSINFSVCIKCKWIKCQCNACGCKYKNF
jgi:hypothetical protein